MLVRLLLVVRVFDGVVDVALWSDVGRSDCADRFSRVELLSSDVDGAGLSTLNPVKIRSSVLRPARRRASQ